MDNFDLLYLLRMLDEHGEDHVAKNLALYFVQDKPALSYQDAILKAEGYIYALLQLFSNKK